MIQIKSNQLELRAIDSLFMVPDPTSNHAGARRQIRGSFLFGTLPESFGRDEVGFAYDLSGSASIASLNKAAIAFFADRPEDYSLIIRRDNDEELAERPAGFFAGMTNVIVALQLPNRVFPTDVSPPNTVSFRKVDNATEYDTWWHIFEMSSDLGGQVPHTDKLQFADVDDTELRYYIASRNGCDCGVFSLFRRGTSAVLADVFILPKHRHNGVATKIVESAGPAISDWESTEVFAVVSLAGAPLYLAYGYVEVLQFAFYQRMKHRLPLG